MTWPAYRRLFTALAIELGGILLTWVGSLWAGAVIDIFLFLPVLFISWWLGSFPAYACAILASTGRFLIVWSAGADWGLADTAQTVLFLLLLYPFDRLVIRKAIAERAAKEERDRLAAGLASISDAVVATDPSGWVCYMNAAAARLTGWSAAEAAGKTLDDVLPLRGHDGREIHPFALCPDGTAATGLCSPGGEAFEALLRTREGRELAIELSASPIADRRRSPNGLIAVFRDVTARRKATEDLRASELRFRSLVQSNPMGMALCDSSGAVQEANDALLATIGRTRDQLVLRPIRWDDITPTEWIPADLEAMREVRERGWCQPYEKECLLPDGRRVPILVGYSLVGSDQELVAFFVLDLSLQRGAEEALRQSQERFRVALDFSLDAFMLLRTVRDRQGSIIDFSWEYANPQAGLLLGLPAQELVGRRLLETFPARTGHGSLFDRYASVVETGQPHDIDHATTGEEGGPDSWIRNMAVRVGDGVAVYFRDVTEERMVEEVLRDSERHLRNILDSLFAFVVVLSPDGVLLEANRAALEMSSLTEADVVGRPFWDAYWWSYSEEVQAEMREAIRLAAEGESSRYDVRVRVRKDRFYVFDFMIAAMRDDSGRVTHLVASAIDISRRKVAERALQAAYDELEEKVRERTEELERKAAELERSNEELRQFANIASHDLQEPLRTVTSYTQFLSKRYQGQLDGTADEFIGFIVDATRRMQRLIQDLLTYARVGNQGGEPSLFSTGEALEESLSNLRGAIDECGAEIVREQLPECSGDRAQIVQLFQNLVGNSIKFRGTEKLRIVVAACRQGTEWVFSVRDNGIGIAPEHRERIFQIFQRLHAREEYPGSGIGLSICKKIVERHGGAIWVESAPERGTIFRFTLPALMAQPPAPGSEIAASATIAPPPRERISRRA